MLIGIKVSIVGIKGAPIHLRKPGLGKPFIYINLNCYNMAKEISDRTTQDLFSEEKRVGRPRTNPLPRKDQLRLNKRLQVQRDKQNGLKRVELKIDSELFSRLNHEADVQGVTRSALIAKLLRDQLQMERS